MTTALVAMSGGVDSSVAAAMMLDRGFDVLGVTLKLWSGPDGGAPTAGCCTVSDADDARRVADQLGIPYYVLDYTADFSTGVIDRFVGEYLSGRTPNPCVECNRTVKFDRLLDHAAELDADLLVTGHYARTRRVDGRWQLLRGVDQAKDQSYVLSMLGQHELSRVRFPVGELAKSETRRIAAGLDLRTAHKSESMDICFVGAGDYRDFLRSVTDAAERPGDIVTVDGDVVGRHRGVSTVTIGQRRGLGVAVGDRRYVVGVDPETSTVVVGPRDRLATRAIEVDDWTWVDTSPPPGAVVDVQYRAHGNVSRGRVDGAVVEFDAPQCAIAPGQTAALYDGGRVLGSGIIARAMGQGTARPPA